MSLNLNYNQISYWNILTSVPSFLYRKLKEEASVVSLSNSLTTSQLIEEYFKHLWVDRDEEGQLIGENELTVYAIIIALSLKEEDESEEFLWNLQDNYFRWIQPLKEWHIVECGRREKEKQDE